MRPLAFVDLETTGATASNDRITEIGIIEVDTDGSVREWQQLVNPGVRISPFIEQLTGISNAMVATAPDADTVMRDASRFVGNAPMVAHNASFDRRFWQAELARAGATAAQPFACTMLVSRRLYPQAS
ncbi:MAG: 3'-5' exonuclease, partial [Burkholderiaceae bacterium]|nr:3'-5' exonuclease [Burkholderiaceae bacterium]